MGSGADCFRIRAGAAAPPVVKLRSRRSGAVCGAPAHLCPFIYRKLEAHTTIDYNESKVLYSYLLITHIVDI